MMWRREEDDGVEDEEMEEAPKDRDPQLVRACTVEMHMEMT